jgi:hypothetical protein
MTVRTWQWMSLVIFALIMTYEAVTEPSSISGIVAGVLFGAVGTQLELNRRRSAGRS